MNFLRTAMLGGIFFLIPLVVVVCFAAGLLAQRCVELMDQSA